MSSQAEVRVEVAEAFCCTECDTKKPNASRVVDHAQGAHELELDESEVPRSTTTVRDANRLFESMYVVNKQAKKYAQKAQEHWNKGKKTPARKNSLRKKALYTLKRELVEGLAAAGEAERVTVHQIDGSDFFCHTFAADEEWSFHTPVNDWEGEPPDPSDRKVLSEFDKTEEKERSNRSLKSSLKTLQSEVDLSANEYLEEEYLSWGWESYFIGWKYL